MGKGLGQDPKVCWFWREDPSPTSPTFQGEELRLREGQPLAQRCPAPEWGAGLTPWPQDLCLGGHLQGKGGRRGRVGGAV